MSTNHSEFSEIPKVELVNFSFSPPGPMGWSSAEYESMLEDPETFLSKYKIRHAEPATGNVELIELPLKKRKPQEAIMGVEPINEVMHETVQSLTQELQEAAEEPAAALSEAAEVKAVKVKKEKKPSSKKKGKDQLIVSEPAAEIPETAVQESAANEEEMIPAASLKAEVTQKLSAFEQPITDQEQSGLRFTSSRRKSKSGPSARKNKVLFLD
ncbi:hypothetical protein LIT25_05715 [Bacillus sp. F19]|nr:hypothetical protein LIT25_05715 [Bacillus sp. F19]